MREHRLDLGLLKSFALLGEDLSGMQSVRECIFSGIKLFRRDL